MTTIFAVAQFHSKYWTSYLIAIVMFPFFERLLAATDAERAVAQVRTSK